MKRYLLIAITLFMLATVASAQNGTNIRGHVADARNANVAGAKVALIARSGARTLTVTDAGGAYSFDNIASGDYVLEVRSTGFVTFTSNAIHVSRGQTQTTDIGLAVEGVNESVIITATGTAQRIDETSKAVSVLDDQSIEAKREVSVAESLRGVPGV